ncbi:excalibur calcium-binding domain-containing protein [Streptomyces sp. VRA16 Mangrove soil]|uniref:excalibur calcium-binding domain-containing protein n=1 Tax=Streptomyces sp. VRA16 Mangrove soil TaxID=2817434 RepID=UPI001A9D022E|nr:excalibur calcium-binding domain-containing protein [Streptomyces sp. VRA16 Mangrove soil]MBO1335532.1 excalibur calcium-binding domain-containing protein [Streptomyces sp. VRA16 Mangrove soil]
MPAPGQDPRSGEESTDPGTTSVDLALVQPKDACPADRYTRRDPDPDPNPDRHQDSGSGSASDHDSGVGGGSVHHRNRIEVRVADKAPLHRGEPGCSLEPDRDEDGIACDQEALTGTARGRGHPALPPRRTRVRT